MVKFSIILLHDLFLIQANCPVTFVFPYRYVDVNLQLIDKAGDFVSDDIWYRVVQFVTNNEDLQVFINILFLIPLFSSTILLLFLHFFSLTLVSLSAICSCEGKRLPWQTCFAWDHGQGVNLNLIFSPFSLWYFDMLHCWECLYPGFYGMLTWSHVNLNIVQHRSCDLLICKDYEPFMALCIFWLPESLLNLYLPLTFWSLNCRGHATEVIYTIWVIVSAWEQYTGRQTFSFVL